jgi:hypothetical protein
MGGMQGWNLFEGVPFEEVFLEEGGHLLAKTEI